ncbi:hypothetical protein B0H14DRAFT_2629180 [Mycena olivaceomarginata]|nr:hypothetical protein B0H14DRAFT_2629180 [Mycena olivaceomarginata]
MSKRQHCNKQNGSNGHGNGPPVALPSSRCKLASLASVRNCKRHQATLKWKILRATFSPASPFVLASLTTRPFLKIPSLFVQGSQTWCRASATSVGTTRSTFLRRWPAPPPAYKSTPRWPPNTGPSSSPKIRPPFPHTAMLTTKKYSHFPNGPICHDFAQYNMGYMSLYDVNSTSDYPSSSLSRPTGYKCPSSPTPLLGTDDRVTQRIESKVSVTVTCSTTQMKNQWETSLSIYKKFVPSLKFTGGGADADEEPDLEEKEAIEMFLKSRKTGGHDIEGLSVKKVKQWQMNSWFGLWSGHYGENPKAVWEVPRLSVNTLSDIKGGSHADDDNDNDSEIETIEQPTATPTTAAAAKVEKGLMSDPRVVKPSTWDRSILGTLNIFFFHDF